MSSETRETRAPFQVLVLPYRQVSEGEFAYCIFLREDAGYWQGIAGGGAVGETALQSAQREAREEAGIDPLNPYLCLETRSSIPASDVCGFLWGTDVILIPEYCFAVEVSTDLIHLSNEHARYDWVSYEVGLKRLKWDSNRTALWELNYKLHNLLTTARRI